ncbi:MAG: hypothetical protein A3J97_08815 [Spirochaetes bacterium RIFOXYC1_FULL_54_7]|nr:MAG: hypothetical protein A3J97_08815 [Spirochaetes bacterium RIFOXYC1_FULL_54_7]
MRCDVCGSDDSLFVVVSDNSQGEVRLCRACALEKGYLSDDGEAASPQLDSILDQLDKPEDAEGACPHCGMGQEQLTGSGRLGCPACVTAFRRQYLLARKRRGLPVGYAGKVPRDYSARLPPAYSATLTGPETDPGASPGLGTLRNSQLLADIESAVLAEDFERAAFLRDRLGSASTGGKPGNVV